MSAERAAGGESFDRTLVTSKAQEQAAAALPEPPSDAAPAVRPSLPSIIVDPELAQATGAGAEHAAGQATAGAAGPGADEPPARDANATAGEPQPAPNAGDSAEDTSAPAGETATHSDSVEDENLSFEQAERFAASIRASWEPALTAQAPAAAAAPAAAPVVPAAPVADAADDEPMDAVSVVPGARQRRNAIVLTALAVLGFAGLVALALSSTEEKPSQAWSGEQPAAPPQTAAAPAQPAAAREPEPPPPVEPEALAATTPEPGAAEQLAAVVEPAAASEAAEPLANAAATPSSEGTTEPAAAQAPEEPVPAPSENAAPPSEAAEPEAPATPSLVRIRVTTRPPGAQLTLDGRPVANPYDARMERGSGEHVLEASAAGYKSRSLQVKLDRDRVVTLRLRKERAAAEPRPKRKPRPPRKQAPSKGAGFVSESPY